MNPKLRARLRREKLVKLTSVITVIALAITVLLTVDNMLLSFVMAFVTNYLLSPIVDFFERRRVSRQAAILIPFLATGLLIAFALYQILPLLTSQAAALEAKLPKYQTDLLEIVASTEERFKGFLKVYDVSFSQTINSWIVERTAALSSSLPSAVSGSLTVLLLTPIFAFFMIQDGRTASRKILAMVPNSLFETALKLHHQLNEQMGGFIRARFIEAAIVGIFVWIGLQISGFPYASLLALFAGVTNLIPYVGPVIGAVPALLIATISIEAMITPSMALNLVIISSIYFVAQLIDVIFVIPLVVARIVNLHPVSVIVVIIIGSQLMGVLGMVISIPVASALKLIFKAFYDQLMDFRAS